MAVFGVLSNSLLGVFVCLMLQFCVNSVTPAQSEFNFLTNNTFGEYNLIPSINYTGTAHDSFSLFGIDRMGTFGTLLVVGGREAGKNVGINSQSSWSYDVASHVWSKLDLHFERSGQCSFQYDGRGYFFGGMGNYSQGGLFASLNLSYVQEGIKSESVVGLPLLNQYIYSSCAIGPIQMNTTFFVFGGSNESTPNVCSNDLMSFNLTSMSWTVVKITNGTLPSPRRGATLNYITYNKLPYLVLIGGECGAKKFNDNLWWFDFTNNIWINQNGTSQYDISYHTATNADEKGLILIHGGVNNSDSVLLSGTYIYQSFNNTWGPVNNTGELFNPFFVNNTNLTSPRSKHSSIYLRQRMFILGGVNDNIAVDASSNNAFLQLSVSFFCNFSGINCGNCLLYPGCGLCCQGNQTEHCACVPGAYHPYSNDVCISNGNQSFVDNSVITTVCRHTRFFAFLLPVTCVVIILIFFLVLAVYIVDKRVQTKLQTQGPRGYDRV